MIKFEDIEKLAEAYADTVAEDRITIGEPIESYVTFLLKNAYIAGAVTMYNYNRV